MIEQLWSLLDIALAAFLGFLIGLERKFSSKEAGIRTHTIVCVASALFTTISKYAFLNAADFDPARVAAQIVPGIGFLCAGMIIYRKNSIYGLTTAAGVWATAGIGMACGGKLYIVAGVTALFLITFRFLFKIKCRLFSTKKMYRLNISFKEENNEATMLKGIFGVEHFYSYHTVRNDTDIICEVTLFTENMYTSERLNTLMQSYPFIMSIQRIDEE